VTPCEHPQDDLIDFIGKFSPRIVRMADEPGEF
jgi:hypothetical protein